MRKLSELAEINPKRQLPEGLSAKDEVSFIPMSDVTESGEWAYRQTRQLKELLFGFTPFLENDVLFAKITPCMENGKGAHAVDLKNGLGFGSTEFHVLRAKSGASARFIFHVCQSRHLRLAAEAHMIGSAGQQRVQKQFFESYEVFDPPAAEQHKVAQILDTLDTQIRQTEALIAKLERIKQGLLTDLLTRGIDQNGQLRPTPDQAPHLYKDSPLGRIPREWNVQFLDRLAQRGSGHTPSKSVPAYWNGGVKWVSLADSGRLDQVHIEETDKEISELGIANSSATKHPAGTVILSRDAGIGKSAILASEMTVSQHFMAWRCGSNLYNVFLYYWLQWMKPRFEAIALGSTIQTIGLGYFKKLQIAAPPVGEQRLIGERMFEIEQITRKNKRLLVKLGWQKDALMDDLLTGRVRVSPLIESKARRTQEEQHAHARTGI